MPPINKPNPKIYFSQQHQTDCPESSIALLDNKQIRLVGLTCKSESMHWCLL